MENLEVFLINLFMLGESFSKHNNQQIRDTTIIECKGFKLEFTQLNIHLKQSNQRWPHMFEQLKAYL